jgi:tRNA U38,U39,U40 pseudouridine synthase TruA
VSLQQFGSNSDAGNCFYLKYFSFLYRKYEYVIPSFALDPEAYRERDYYNLKAGRKEIEDARTAASTDVEGAPGPESDANQGLGLKEEPVESKPGASQAEPMDSERPGEEQPGTSGGVQRENGGGRVAGEENVRGEEPPAKRVKIEPGWDQGLESEPGTLGAVKLEPGLDHGSETKPGVSGAWLSNSGESSGQESAKQEEREGVLAASLAGVERFLIPKAEREGAVNGEEKKPFKYTPAVQKRLNRLLAKYTGTHNFHNFTTRVKANDGQVGPSFAVFISSSLGLTKPILVGMPFYISLRFLILRPTSCLLSMMVSVLCAHLSQVNRKIYWMLRD